ncbi:insulinase family protein [Allosphingosinicella flava]|uniref:Insulinase family protein n=1 Tax=Allosphingosinicella flava TaxID=2771430 RepID=A0A7T2GJ97_9SPHN|nr:insulinase family protein [Sphingosinicella flava]QPQ54874.1 insulinase family protein [Sphingosinicella flava]
MHRPIRWLIAAFALLATPLAAAQQGSDGWFYANSDIAPDPAWTFGTLPNGVRYAVRKNALPQGQVSIRVRIDTGSLNEEDHQQGWAHFVEHLAFRGSASFGDREARHIWQQFGASFGSDTNATTDSTQTVYQLDLPHADQTSLDKSLHVLSEMVDTALFAPEAVDAERKIVLAEKRRRSELASRYDEVSRPLFYAGLKYAQRDTIGTETTLAGADAAGLKAFYERWYRPERATIVMVGDADPKMMADLIAKRFGDWKAEGPPPPAVDYGAIIQPKEGAASLAYPGAPYNASVVWLRPYEAEAPTLAREKLDFERTLATQIINRRLEAHARSGKAAYVGAGVGNARSTNIADTTQLNITAREGQWRESLNQSFAIIADALRAPPSEAEIARELQNMRRAAVSAVEGENTIKSQQWAQALVGAIDGNSVITSAKTSLILLDQLSPAMTPQAVWTRMKSLFEGSGPRMVLLSPSDVGGQGAAMSALLAAQKAAPATRVADRVVTFDDLPKLGAPGREVSRQEIADLGVTIVRFANGSTLTFKKTDYEQGRVGVKLLFGEGVAGLPTDRSTLAFMSGVVAPSGLADLDLDGLERLLTGRRIAMNFAVTEDAFQLSGSTNKEDLADQMRLLATKLAYPRWDDALFARAKAGMLDSYDLAFASASARAGREFSAFARRGDLRWATPEKSVISAATDAEFKAFFAPALSTGPIEAIVVGDVDIETAVAAMKATIAALPARPAAAQPRRPASPPAPSPKPVVFTHKGDPSQAQAIIGWTTFGGMERRKELRALGMAANILQVRLFDRLREEEGASYSPTASSGSSDIFPDWGIFYASAEIRPESADTFFRIAREIVADLAAKPVEPDEFARAQNPIVSGIERRLATNGYWLDTLEGWTEDPRLIEQTRTFLADYQAMTAEDLRAAVAAHVTEQGDWSMLVLPEQKAGTVGD